MNLTACMLFLHNANKIDGSYKFENDSTLSTTKISQEKDMPLSSGTYIAISIYMFCLTLAGVLENGAVIYVYLARANLRNTTNSLVTFLSVCNFLISSLAVPFVGAAAMAKTWLFGQIGCEFHGFIVTGLGLTQIGILSVISLERYLIIVRRSNRYTVKRYIVVISICVIYGFSCALFPLVGWNSYRLEAAQLSCAIDWNKRNFNHISYCVFLLVVGLFIPLVIIVTAYTYIIRGIKHQRVHSTVDYRKQRSFRRETKVANTVLILIGAFLFSWMPYTIYSIVSMTDATQNVPAIISSIPSFTAKTSVVWNPIIYIHRNRKFRAAILETFPCLESCFNFRCKCSNNNGNMYASVNDSAEQRTSGCNSSFKQLDYNGSTTKQTEFAMVQITNYKCSLVKSNILLKHSNSI